MRIKGFELPGQAKIDLAEQQQGAAENPAAEKLPKPPTLDPSPRAAVANVEARLGEDLKKIEEEKRQATLLRALAATRVEAGHEFTYNRIFGSQIVALKRLNEAGRVTVDFAREIYKPYAKQFPQVYSNYSFDGWLGFLTSSGLVMQNGNSLEITDIGREFFALPDGAAAVGA
jgi:hypothetical protein